MNLKLSELFIKKHYWENKKDKIYSQILLDYCLNAPLFLLITAELFFFKTRKNLFNFKWEKGSKWATILSIVLVICLLIGLISVIRNIYNCFYKLPRYRQKVDEIDRQIVEELKKLKFK